MTPNRVMATRGKRSTFQCWRCDTLTTVRGVGVALNVFTQRYGLIVKAVNASAPFCRHCFHSLERWAVRKQREREIAE